MGEDKDMSIGRTMMVAQEREREREREREQWEKRERIERGGRSSCRSCKVARLPVALEQTVRLSHVRCSGATDAYVAPRHRPGTSHLLVSHHVPTILARFIS